MSRGPNRLLGYMSGYYCRDCGAIKSLFDSPESSGLGIPCIGTVPFESLAELSAQVKALPMVTTSSLEPTRDVQMARARIRDTS